MSLFPLKWPSGSRWQRSPQAGADFKRHGLLAEDRVILRGSGPRLQYPATDGSIAHPGDVIARAHEVGAPVVMAADLANRQQCFDNRKLPRRRMKFLIRHVHPLQPASHFRGRQALLADFGEEGLPYNTYYGDGSPIAEKDIAEIHAPFSHQEWILRQAMGLGDDVSINASGGALAANAILVAGLARIGEASRQIWGGKGRFRTPRP